MTDAADVLIADIVTDDMEQFLAVLPERARDRLAEHRRLSDLVEVVLDLGRLIEARFPDGFEVLGSDPVTREDMELVVANVGEFDRDNRAGIERTLHRISAIRNRHSDVIGLTCRVGRAVQGTIDIVRDVIETGDSILFMGPPGIGKTTKLREVARVLASEMQRRVVIVDTNNEIAGDGDIPHPAIGRARRMQVPNGRKQHDIMIQAVENHMPEVIIVDEIGNEAEAAAARTIAERGVQLVATAHGNEIQNLMANPTLCDLIGGIEAVTLGDDEARRRGCQKVVLERRAQPTFEIAVQLESLHRLAIHHDVATTVDRLLLGKVAEPEVREVRSDGRVEVVARAQLELLSVERQNPAAEQLRTQIRQAQDTVSGRKLFIKGVTRGKVEKAIRALRSNFTVISDPVDADLLLSSKNHADEIAAFSSTDRPMVTVRSNTYTQIYEALREFMVPASGSIEEFALQEVLDAIELVTRTNEPVELLPQNSYVRRLQHETAGRHQFRSGSVGKEPRRRVMIYPD